jgi:hypothetical protein
MLDEVGGVDLPGESGVNKIILLPHNHTTRTTPKCGDINTYQITTQLGERLVG